MKTYKNLHSFTVKSVSEIKEINATLVSMEHERSGASLFFLDREDDNKTFAISFKTIPEDDTGIFHILEHSVLCGSQKFPVKDPLTELINGSVPTYINAVTYGERTVYPVSCKNDKALLGLADVYLDAVLHPSAISEPNIFMQEGYRYEIEDGKLVVNGVVYNEMKGVYSSADDYADYLVTKLLSPGGTYSYDSGGNPDFIPDLTYEAFVNAHKKFYHPSNACIFLDGTVDLDAMLALIDSHLSGYERSYEKIEIDDGGTPITEPYITTYPIEKGEGDKDKTRIYLCHNTYKYAEREKNTALALATEAIADSNNAPLTKRIMESGLCESFSFYPTRSYSLNALNAIFIGVKDGAENELIALYESELGKILDEGIPRDILDSTLRRLEFNTREADFGSYPKGMYYMSVCIEAASFGTDPGLRLSYERLLEFLHEKIDTDYYRDLLREAIATPRATLILHPDKHFTEKKDEAAAKLLLEKYNSLTKKDIADIKKKSKSFAAWQKKEDSDEALATIPRLKISDLDLEEKRTPTDVYTEDGCTVISHPIHTGGISYAELCFDVSDIDEKDIPYVRLFTELMGEWRTEKGSAANFSTRVKKHLGMFNLSPLPIKRGNDPKIYTVLRLSCLESEKDNAIALVDEYLYSSIIDDKEIIKLNAKQIYTASAEHISSRGDGVAMMRDAAKHSKYEALNEALFGYSYHVFIKNLAEGWDSDISEALGKLKCIRDKYFKRERLTVGITEKHGKEFAKGLISAIKTGGIKAGACKIKTLPAVNEGIAVPATVSFAARTSNMHALGEDVYTGAFATLGNIATYEILWNEIRLKGGAYDTGFFARSNSGTVGCYSYRDPNPSRSDEVFKNIHQYVDEFLGESPDLTKYIIGTIGASDSITTPRSRGSAATRLYLSNKSFDDIARMRRECIETTSEDIAGLSEMLKQLAELSTLTVVGAREALEEMELDAILDI